MGIKRRSPGKWQVFSTTGVGAGYKLHTYVPGTTTDKATYTDKAGSVANANPVVFDSRGEADIWWDGNYDLKLVDADDNLIWTLSDFGEGEDTINYGNFNLVNDGGFEDDSDGDTLPDQWTVTTYADAGAGAGAAIIDTTDQIEGAQSLKFTSVGDGGGYAVPSSFSECREGDVITANWMQKSDDAGVRNVVEIIWYTAAQVQISTSTLLDDSSTNPTSWTEKQGSATAPSTARFFKVRFIGCHSSDATAGSTWFDDIRVTDALRSAGIKDEATTQLVFISDGIVSVANSTPSSWGSSYPGVQIGFAGSIITTDSTEFIAITSNLYHNGSGYRAITNAQTARMSMNNGEIYFSVAASTAADAAPSETTVLKFDNAGDIIIESSAVIYQDADNNEMHISGGDSTSSGCNMLLRGGNHSSQANDFIVRSDTDYVLNWDDSELDFIVGNSNLADTGINIVASSTGNPILRWLQGSTTRAYLQYTDSGNLFNINADGEIRIQPNNTTALTLNTDGTVDVAGLQRWQKGGDLTAASTLTLDTDGNYFDVMGTTAITAISATGVGTVIKLHFDDSLLLTHDGTALVLPNDADILTAAGDEAEFIEYGSGYWRLVNYLRNSDTVDGFVYPSTSWHFGLNLFKDTDANHDVLINPGEAISTASDTYKLRLTSQLTKQIDAAWAAGDDAGGMFTGSVAADTVYYIYLIRKDSDGSIDAGFDTSSTAANIPSGYTHKSLIGYVVTDDSANINGLFQYDGPNAINTVEPYDVSAGSEHQIVIPAAMNHVFVTITALSADGSTDKPIFRLGDSGGLETGGYFSFFTTITGTNACDLAVVSDGIPILNDANSGNVYYGVLELFRLSSTQWGYKSNFAENVSDPVGMTTGYKATSANTNLLALTFDGSTDEFDNGEMAVYMRA